MCDREDDLNVGVRRDLDLAAGVGGARLVEAEAHNRDVRLSDGDRDGDIAFIVIAVALDREHIFARIQDLGVGGAVDRNNKPCRIRIGDVDCADKDVVADHGAVIGILFELHSNLSCLERHRFDGEVAIGELEIIVTVKSLVHERDLQHARDSVGFLRREIDTAAGDLEHKFLRCVVVGKFGLTVEVHAVRRADVRLCRAVGHDSVRDIDYYPLRCDLDDAGIFGEGDGVVADLVFALDDNDLCAADVAVGKIEHAVRVESCDQAVRVAINDGIAALCRRNCGDLGRAVAVDSGTGSSHADGDGSRDDGDAAFFGGEDIVVCVALGTCGKRLGQSDLACRVGGCRRVGRRGIGRSKAVRHEHSGDRAVIVRHGVAGVLELFSIGLLDRLGSDGDFKLVDDEGDVDRIGRLFAHSREVELALGVSGERKHGGVIAGVARRDEGIAIVGLARRRASGDRRGVVERDALDAAGGGAGAELRPVRLRAVYDGDRDVVGSFRCRVGKAASDDLAGLVIDIDAGKDGGALDVDDAAAVDRQVVVGGVGVVGVERHGEGVISQLGDRPVGDRHDEQVVALGVGAVVAEDLSCGDDVGAALALDVRNGAHRVGIACRILLQRDGQRSLLNREGLRRVDVVVVDERAVVVGGRRGAERIVAGIARGVGSDAARDVLHLEVIGGVQILFGVDDAVNAFDRDRILLGAVVGHGVGVRKCDGDVLLGDGERDDALSFIVDGVVVFDFLKRHTFQRSTDPLIGGDITAHIGGFYFELVLFGDAVPVVDGAEHKLVRRHCALRVVALIVGHGITVLERGFSVGIICEVEHERSRCDLDSDGLLGSLKVS